nr:hypothetical protein [uncultured bacterium]
MAQRPKFEASLGLLIFILPPPRGHGHFGEQLDPLPWTGTLVGEISPNLGIAPDLWSWLRDFPSLFFFQARHFPP